MALGPRDPDRTVPAAISEPEGEALGSEESPSLVTPGPLLLLGSRMA